MEVNKMARKIWYEIELIDVRKTSENGDIISEVVARVKSKGLAQLIFNQIKEIYKDNKDVLVNVR